ncbi:hypothetical protein Ccrd_009149 [Cynara cardunculus var. scolymus]|uniref:Uncharacterized protein n=1 Tax=Cynara cardunculus var. scolymus TaxID=59895 RepID=A0A103YP12_CYNCS|nr:hypothetical protein Ccrd_009149 [Cynara cardunculus var. scolymus]
MGWLQSIFSPVKILWRRIQSVHTRRRKRMQFDRGKGLYVLYEDVKCCSCEDVQMLWSMVVGPEAGFSI